MRVKNQEIEYIHCPYFALCRYEELYHNLYDRRGDCMKYLCIKINSVQTHSRLTAVECGCLSDLSVALECYPEALVVN